MRGRGESVDVRWRGRHFRARRYGMYDEPRILDQFFFWKMTALMAEFTGDKKPQMPETFSEPFCCLVCGLLHRLGQRGPDAFLQGSDGYVESAVEIKATITNSGFTSEDGPLDFDELFWLSFAGYDSLSYQIYRIHKREIQLFVRSSRVASDRGTINLRRVVERFRLHPSYIGRIGTVRE